jgi:hypothetical protein
LKELREIEKRHKKDKSVGRNKSAQGFEKQNCKRPNSLGRHRNIYSGNCDVIKYIYCIKGLQFLSTSKRHRDILEIIGNLAPFHSKKQKISTTKSPDTKGARTTAGVQGNVTSPYPGTMGGVSDMHVGLSRVVLTQMRGKMKSVHPSMSMSVSPAPR